MEFKRSNSSRGPLTSGRRGHPVGVVTPKRSTTPLTKTSARGAPTPPASTANATAASPTPPLPPRLSGPPSGRESAPESPRPPSVTAFERSGSTTGTRGGFKRSNTAVGMRRAEAIKHKNRVNVYVRVRAFREDECSGDMGQLAVNMDDGAVEVSVPKKGRFTFGFDGCFWSNDRACPSGKAAASQEDVFDEVGRPLVENALAGYNAAVMAYGQTGSGKTFTSFGPPGSIGTPQEGLIPRVCNMIFARAANSAQKGVTYTVSASMLEVYLEDVFDLLNHRKQLSVRNDFTNNTFGVVGQRTVSVKSYKDVLAVLNKAEPLRTFAATNIHDHSSRAHTLFLLEVQTHFDAPELAPRCARILLADLAGCERIKLAGTEEGLAFEQARNINLSLLALGSCIEAVATRGRGNARPIPEFRNSTLTKLLKDYIGGNSISTMMVTISPSEHDANLSVQTLRFADRAKQITTHAHVNTVDPEKALQDGSDLSDRWRDEYLRKKEALYAEYQLKGTIEKLLSRIADLEEKLRACADDELALHLTTEVEELQKALTEADYQMGLQRQILYGEFLMLEDELREMNTKMQEMKEEHEEAMEGLLGEEAGRYEEMRRGYEARLRAQQDDSAAALAASSDDAAALRRLVAELQARLAAVEADNAALRDQLAAQQAAHDADRSASARVHGDLEAQVAALRALLAEQESAAAAEEAALRSDVDALRTLHATSEEKAAAQVAHLETAAAQLREHVQTREAEHVKELDALHTALATAETAHKEQLDAAAQTAKQREAAHLAEVHALKAAWVSSEAAHADRTALQERVHTDTEQRLANTAAELHDTRASLAQLQQKLQETEDSLQGTEETLQETATKLEETEAKLEHAESTIEETQSKLDDTDSRLQETAIKLADTEETLQETAAKLADTEETLQETAAKLADTEETLQETATKLADTEETLQETATKLADTEETLQETATKLADTEETLQETATKLADTEETLQETAAKLEETGASLSAEIASLEVQLRTAETLGQQQGRYIADLTTYVRGAYAVTLDSVTELQVTALAAMVGQAGHGMRCVTGAARAEVDRMREMYNFADGNYKETAARFDMLRRILGKIDQDVKEASVEIDGQERRQSGSSHATPRRLGDVSNRENSMEGKGRSPSRASSVHY
ncbi:kinesin [Novymonas esmeraldas]|uniref:Kinesin n=1 Tax=Novymonas esmeraldas TaxID=1808958 RepID=A0AAW0ENM4_9TRYP